MKKGEKIEFTEGPYKGLKGKVVRKVDEGKYSVNIYDKGKHIGAGYFPSYELSPVKQETEYKEQEIEEKEEKIEQEHSQTQEENQEEQEDEEGKDNKGGGKKSWLYILLLILAFALGLLFGQLFL